MFKLAKFFSELAASLTRALRRRKDEPNDVIDMFNDAFFMFHVENICNVLVKAGVLPQLVSKIKEELMNCKENAPSYPVLLNAVVRHQLCNLLEHGMPSFTPEIGKTSVVLFVGMSGSGITTTCSKYAYYYKEKGFRPGLVCADSFGAGAYEQLTQNANNIGVPCYGSHRETDAVKIAVAGVEYFKREKNDLIIIDSHGRNRQNLSLFEEMHKLSKATDPDFIIMVVDSTVGCAVVEQLLAFKDKVKLGGLILTKLDSPSKGGGALSGVAALCCPVLFIGTGPYLADFRVFEANTFVTNLLAVEPDYVPDKMDEFFSVSPDQFTLRTFRQLLEYSYKKGRFDISVLSLFPYTIRNELVELIGEMKQHLVFIDSMSNDELDSDGELNESRIRRIAYGSGRQAEDVEHTLHVFRILRAAWKNR